MYYSAVRDFMTRWVIPVSIQPCRQKQVTTMGVGRGKGGPCYSLDFEM